MDVVIHRVGKYWHSNGQPVRFDAWNPLDTGWTFTLTRRKAQMHLEVHRYSERIYRCNISTATFVLITIHGAAALSSDTEHNRALANKFIEALSVRPGIVFLTLNRLAGSATINGMTLRTQLGSRNNFTDGTIKNLSRVHRRTVVRCVGGTYLIRVLRHDNTAIYAVEVTVQADYDEARLLNALRHLA